jgi:hypothetical protein
MLVPPCKSIRIMAARQPLRDPRKALPPGEAVPGRRRGRGSTHR